MDQYVRWRGGSYDDEFYTDPVIRRWYQDWITHVLARVSTLTGVAYADDPTVAMWELANEPRCLSTDAYPRSPACTTQTLTTWADEMTRHIKSVDTRHLVSVGDGVSSATTRPTHPARPTKTGPAPAARAWTRWRWLAGAELIGQRGAPPPVADHDATTVDSNQTANLLLAANDVAFHATVRRKASTSTRPSPGSRPPRPSPVECSR